MVEPQTPSLTIPRICKAMYGPSVTYTILPLPIGNSGQGKKRKSEDSPPGKSSKHHKTDSKGPKPGKGNKDQKRGKGKGKGKSEADNKASAAWDAIPELRGMWFKVRGNFVCPKYNLGECDEEVKPGAFCSRGQHACCYPRCFQQHSMVAAHNK